MTRVSRLALFLPLALTLLLLPACGSARAAEQYLEAQQPEVVGELTTGRIVRQSFWSVQDGLAGIKLFPATYARPDRGTVRLRLLDDRGQVVHESRFEAASVVDNQPLSFSFAPQPRSAERRYQVEISADSAPGEAITLWHDQIDRYAGQLQVDGAPRTGDLSLGWEYRYEPAIGLRFLPSLAGRVGPSFLLFLLLWVAWGAALVLLIIPDGVPARSGSAGVGWTLALGGAFLLLVPHAADLLGIRMGAGIAAALLPAPLLTLAMRWRRAGWPVPRPGRTGLLYTAVLLILAGGRLAALHGLSAPMWGDGLQHTLIVQQLIAQGGLFDNYLPLVPLGSFTYHAGFHLLSAWPGWIAGSRGVLSAATATLVGGQWLNIVAVLMAGLLAETVLPDERRRAAGTLAAILAIVIAGFWSIVPEFYLNWSRYTQLAGQLFLAPALAGALEGWRPGRRRRMMLLAALPAAALALSHYRVLILYAVALPLLLAVSLLRDRGRVREILGRAIGSGMIAALLILPWFLRLARGLIPGFVGDVVTKERPGAGLQELNEIGDLSRYVPELMWGMALAAALWLLWKRRDAVWLALWVPLLFVVANPYQLLRLPGTGLVNNFLLQIGLYLPLGALIGAAAAEGWHAAAPRLGTRRGGVATMLGLTLLAGALWDGVWQGGTARPVEFAMLTRADIEAGEWIRANLPAEAVIHINGFFAFGGTVAAGSDGGWWLWLTGERATTIPPMLYHHESGIEPDYIATVERPLRRLQAAESEPAALARAMRQEDVRYLYIGARNGLIGLPPTQRPLDAAALASSPDFHLLYDDGLVRLFEVTP